jgi:hypothetical protein
MLFTAKVTAVFAAFETCTEKFTVPPGRVEAVVGLIDIVTVGGGTVVTLPPLPLALLLIWPPAEQPLSAARIPIEKMNNDQRDQLKKDERKGGWLNQRARDIVGCAESSLLADNFPIPLPSMIQAITVAILPRAGLSKRYQNRFRVSRYAT